MSFEFHWKNKEANFGLPADKEIDGGTHFSIEIMLRYKGKFVAARRPKGYPGHQLPPKVETHPKGCLYFSHDLPHWGETLDEAIKRIVKSQLNTGVKGFEIVDLTMETYPDELHEEGNRQWAITLYVIAELTALPKLTMDVTEVVTFGVSSVPDDMGWWEKSELEEFLKHAQ